MSDTESNGQQDTAVQEVLEVSVPVLVTLGLKESETPTSPLVEVTTDTAESNETQKVKELVKNEDLSYEDGNLIVVADNTTFQVHRSILSRKSALFKDLLSLPQPESEYKVDGMPVVPLLESAKDAALLIDAMYNGEKYRYREDEGPEWPIVYRLLTLGTKYQIDELREEAIQQLERRYPKKISGWDETCRTDADYPGGQSTILVSYSIEEDLVIANVSRAMDLPDIHLAALYGCCSLPFDTLVNGRMSEDGTCERLCSEDLIACLQGKENLLVAARANIRMNLFAPESPPPNCRSPRLCAEKTAVLLAQFRTAEASPQRMYDPLRPEDHEIERHCADQGLCHDCVKFYLTRHAALRQEVRSNLGSYICAQRKQ